MKYFICFLLCFFIIKKIFFRWLCLNYDHQPNSTKLVRLILQRLVAFAKKFLEEVTFNVDVVTAQTETATQFGQCGFLYKGNNFFK